MRKDTEVIFRAIIEAIKSKDEKLALDIAARIRAATPELQSFDPEMHERLARYGE
ncbi:hypothetical protein ACLBV5_13215 [Brevundimonas sp. M1A4_2e]